MATLQSTVTCPHCGHCATETVPTDSCQYFYQCRQCGVVLRPKPGDCCVFCSHGDRRCPFVQDDVPCPNAPEGP
jgi:hypothetical protein